MSKFSLLCKSNFGSCLTALSLALSLAFDHSVEKGDRKLFSVAYQQDLLSEV
jgi:hypothetical protein